MRSRKVIIDESDTGDSWEEYRAINTKLILEGK